MVPPVSSSLEENGFVVESTTDVNKLACSPLVARLLTRNKKVIDGIVSAIIRVNTSRMEGELSMESFDDDLRKQMR